MIAVDAFADAQTLALAEKTFTVTYGDLGLSACAVQEAIESLESAGIDGVLIGSGLEAQAELLEWITQRLPLFGNSPEVIARIKCPRIFFDTLRKLDIPYPATYFDRPSDAAGLLVKNAGGCGGTHIRFVQPENQTVHQVADADADYYQQPIAGLSVSILFLAHACGVELIGFNEQWQNPALAAPFRYGGAVGHADLPSAVKQQLWHAAQKLTLEFGLRGLNSLDAVFVDVAGESRVWVLEVNPRLSATIECYSENQPQLLCWHIRACSGEWLSFETEPAKNNVSSGHAIIYAEHDVMVDGDMPWPEWIKDHPPIADFPIQFQRDQPICTVTAQAKTAAETKKIINERVDFMRTLLNKK